MEAVVTTRFCAALALGLGVLMAGPAMAKPVHPAHHAARHAVHRNKDVRYAQGFYDYRAASIVHEGFRDSGSMRWHRGRAFDRHDYFYGERRDERVVENLRSGDFTGGVGYGVNGDVPSFVDGFGQTHFFVGNFRGMAPGSRFDAPRFGAP